MHHWFDSQLLLQLRACRQSRCYSSHLTAMLHAWLVLQAADM
jgi:hypothetical protein